MVLSLSNRRKNNEQHHMAHFIVLERQIKGLDTEMDGKSLARHAESLDAEASRLGVRPLSEFISIDPDAAADFLEGEGMDAGDVELPPLRQFSAEDGIATVAALLEGNSFGDDVEVDLRECERILTVAAQERVGWHLEVDF